MSKNMVEPERPQIIWRRVACWISKATRTQAHARAYSPTPMHTDQYVIIISFAQQQWFRERASLLRHTYIVCLSVTLR
jgi:hypothetical protein